MDDVTALWDERAEKAVLGAMLMSAQAVDDVADIVAARDFRRPAHQVIAAAIAAVHAEGCPADPLTVKARLEKDGDLQTCGGAGYLHTLFASVPAAANAAHYARIVRDYAIRERIRETGMRMIQRACHAGQDPAGILAGAEADLDGCAAYAETGSTGLMDIEEFCGARFEHAEPVIPGLLGASERVIVVAGEGMGKSTLARQVWVCTAAGVHPFTGDPAPPKRALLIDLENPPQLVQAKTRQLLDIAERLPGWDPRRARIWAKPGGVDVRSPADQQLLAQVVKQSAPDLICAGPLYKMTIDMGERAEQLHGAIAAFWNRIRERHGCALWLEAHAPMGQNGQRDMRPLGSGVWQRWPEFGISLTVKDRNKPSEGLRVGRFRGDRDERAWPVGLVRAPWGSAWQWPWKAVYPDGTFTERKETTSEH